MMVSMLRASRRAAYLILAFSLMTATLVAATSLAKGTSSIQSSVDDTQAIENAFTRAIDTLQRATIVVAPSALPASASDSAIHARALAVNQILGNYFTGEPLARFSAALQSSLQSQIDQGLRDIDGGAADVQFESLTVIGDQASGTARALTWIRTEPTVPGKWGASSPSGWWDYTFHAVKSTHRWLFDGMTFTPEAGSAP